MADQNGKVVTREKLFEQAWESPISQLAKAYGISDVGLAKISKRMEIPRPPRGYWSKLKVWRAPLKPRLRPISDIYSLRSILTVNVHKDDSLKTTRRHWLHKALRLRSCGVVFKFHALEVAVDAAIFIHHGSD